MVNIVCDGEITVLEFAGSFSSLDPKILEDVGGVMLGEATHAEPPLLVLDFAGTSYVGSSFIEIMIRTRKQVLERGGKLVVCELQPFCCDILHHAKLDEYFGRYATRAEAIAAIRR